MVKVFQFVAETVNNEILEFPKIFTLNCENVIPLGMQIVRSWDENLCAVAKRVFIVLDGQTALGTTLFNSLAQYNAYIQSVCECCNDRGCGVTINGCLFTINGCRPLINNN